MTLMQRLNDEYDPTDADRAMKVAARGLRLLRVCERILAAERVGFRVGRDDSIELAVKMCELGEAIGLLEYGASAAASIAFHAALAEEAGLTPLPAPPAAPQEEP